MTDARSFVEGRLLRNLGRSESIFDERGGMTINVRRKRKRRADGKILFQSKLGNEGFRAGRKGGEDHERRPSQPRPPLEAGGMMAVWKSCFDLLIDRASFSARTVAEEIEYFFDRFAHIVREIFAAEDPVQRIDMARDSHDEGRNEKRRMLHTRR